MTTTVTSMTRIDQLRTEIEDVWSHLDNIFASLSPRDWTRRHGRDWVVADVPYHLSYFDREVVAIPLERGTGEPGPGERLLRSLSELNDWNARMFAQRPAGQAAKQSLEEMQASRDRIRAVLSRLTDADLDRFAWSFLAGLGRRRMGDLLHCLVAHTWSHLIELRLHLKRKDEASSAEPTHRALAFYTRVMPMSFDRQQAARMTAPFVAVMEFTGPGGGAWTFRVAEGRCLVEETSPATLDRPDLKLTMSPETFIKMSAKTTNPMLLIVTRQVRVKGLSRMGTFGKLFPDPEPDAIIDPASVTL
jgi:hypothetical protein